MQNQHCPQCGHHNLVRARIRVLRGIGFARGAICVTCGHRFRVSRAVFSNLRLATPGEPFVTVTDLYDYMYHVRMTWVHIVICCIASALGLLLGVWLGIVWNQWLGGLVFLPVLGLGWWFGHWLSPPKRTIPGHCSRCLYNLRGVTGGRCPECGATVNSQVARNCAEDTP